MTTYAPPRRYSNTRPYDENPGYNGQPPQLQVPHGQEPYFPAPPQQQELSYQRRRGSSNVSQHSQHSSYTRPPPQPQHLSSYGRRPSQQQQQQSQQQQPQDQYYPEPPPGPQTPNQLHPPEAYAQDPFAHRQRRESATSHRSSHSHRSSTSHKSDLHRSGRKDGERATLGDSLYGMWYTLKNVIPTSKR